MAQVSNQLLATTKLETNKAIFLKTKKVIKSKMYFVSLNNKYITVNA